MHVPPRITRQDFQAGGLKPGSYSYEDLSAALIDHLSRTEDEYTPIQLEGLQTYKYNGSWNLGNPENIEDLRKFYDIFNAVIFNGVLPSSSHKLHWYERTHKQGTEGAYCEFNQPGEELDTRFKIEQPFSRIWMKPAQYCQQTDRISWYLNVLAHEMLHSLFAIYACRCSFACSEKHRAALHDWLGHCASWQAAAYAIEQAIEYNPRKKGRLLNLKLFSDREGDLMFAIQNGCNIPPDTELRRLGLDIKEIRNGLKEHGATEAKAYRFWKSKQQLVAASCCLRDWWDADRDPVVVPWTDMYPTRTDR